MHGMRPAFALDPRRFGRRYVLHDVPEVGATALADDFKLFAVTFAGGFLFVSVFFA